MKKVVAEGLFGLKRRDTRTTLRVSRRVRAVEKANSCVGPEIAGVAEANRAASIVSKRPEAPPAPLASPIAFIYVGMRLTGQY